MKTIRLNRTFKLGFENGTGKTRLVVFKNGEELACRKETFKNLNKFTNSAQKKIFKGRLQLFKDSGNINIEVKGEVVGTVQKEVFQKNLI